MKGYKRVSIEERVEIARLLDSGLSKAEVARRLNRQRSTISREMGIWTRYDPLRSDLLSKERVSRRNGGKRKIQKCSCLGEYINRHIKRKWSPVQISISFVISKRQANANKPREHLHIYLSAGKRKPEERTYRGFTATQIKSE